MALADSNTDAWWKSCCDRLILQLAAESVVSGRPFDAHALTERGLPDPDSGQRVGPRFAAAAKRGLIVPAGYAPSRRPTVNSSAARTWMGTPLALEMHSGQPLPRQTQHTYRGQA